MYVLDYLIYHLKPYGIVREPQHLPDKLGVGEFMPPPEEVTADSNEDSVEDGNRLNTTISTTTAPADKVNNNAGKVV